MKKLLMFVVLFAFVLGSMASASENRVYTMGDANNIVKDEYNIWMYPSTINQYPRLLTMCIDGDIDQMGAHFQFGQDTENPWVLGAYFEDGYYWPDILDDVYYGDGFYYLEDNRRISLFYGRNLGEMPFGFTLDIIHSSTSYEAPDDNPEAGLSKYTIGFGFSPMEGKAEIGIGFSMMSWTDKDGDGVDNTKPSGNMEFMATGRYWMEGSGKYTWVPHAALWYEKQGREDYTDGVLDGEETNTEMAFDLGCGMNYEADEDILAIADMGFQFWNEKGEWTPATGDAVENKESNIALPYFRIGLDAKVFKWLDVRAGTYSTWDRWKEEDVADETTDKHNSVDTDLFLGIGLHWGNLEIDGEMDPDFVEDGPYFLSGEYEDMFYSVSVTYWLD
ncbi:MAG: hypothetical protein GY841_18840 [FCB group bacterium]|nr:hypothetical protein [FCB group bacterium]